MNALTDTRQYLISKGFKVSTRGRFSKEMVKVLKESGLTFERPVKDPKERESSNSVPLV